MRLVARERENIRAGDVSNVDEVAELTAVFVHLGRLPAFERAAEDARDPGVGGVPRHSGSVHVVVSQRGDGDACVFACEGVAEVLLVELRCCVDVSRVEVGVLGNRNGYERASALRACRLELSAVECVRVAGRRTDDAVVVAASEAFSVDDHAAREDEPA